MYNHPPHISQDTARGHTRHHLEETKGSKGAVPALHQGRASLGRGRHPRVEGRRRLDTWKRERNAVRTGTGAVMVGKAVNNE